MTKFHRYLIKPNGGGQAQAKAIDDDAAEGKTFASSGVKSSYGTPRRANGDTNGQDAMQTENTSPQAESADRADGQAAPPKDDRDKKKNKWDKKPKKQTGQNTKREYGWWGDKKKLCSTRQFYSEFSPLECKHGEKCKHEHDLRKYLDEHKQDDLKTEYFETCPVYGAHGFCPVGWQCRFARSHSEEVTREDGRKELVLSQDEEKMKAAGFDETTKALGAHLQNSIGTKDRIDLERRRVKFERSDEYAKWLTDAWNPQQEKSNNTKRADKPAEGKTKDEDTEMKETEAGEQEGGVKLILDEDKQEVRASYGKEAPYLPSEKRRLYYGPETPVLAPLTTQGNLPFRRLCSDLGAQVTWSEMSMGLPLLQGQKGEWALVKSHKDELLPPTVNPNADFIPGYDNSKDMKFGVQIACNKPWIAFKATEALAKYTPTIRAIDFNCGCPIDMVFNSGGGSAFLDTHPKLEKILRGMNALSGDIPIQTKLRMGVKDKHPTADKLVERLVMGGHSAQQDGLGPCGVAAVTLHGRSRQQRYTRLADWEYIGKVSALIKDLKKKQDAAADTVREVDLRNMPNGGKVYFIGNGDVFCPEDYSEHIRETQVDSIMIARGALIKPWIFEEIATGQPLDKSSTERMQYIEKFCRYGMDTWGSDEMGIGTTRRFLLEWLSFTHRYIPLGVLEVLPPKINERPQPYVGRDDKETLLASDNHKDWLKIR